MKTWKLDRIISVATLVTSVMALFLVLKKPTPVSPPQPVAAAVAITAKCLVSERRLIGVPFDGLRRGVDCCPDQPLAPVIGVSARSPL